jgi:hypothetical protein
MARGRDATDVAMTTSFGPTTLKKFTVVTDEIATPTVTIAPVQKSQSIPAAAMQS